MSTIKGLLLTGDGVNGTGTANTITKWSDADTLTDSIITDDGSTVTVSGDLSATNIAGTLSTAAQTNITSVGTLSSLTVAGALNGTISTAAQPNITSVNGSLTAGLGEVIGTLNLTESAYKIEAGNFFGDLRISAPRFRYFHDGSTINLNIDNGLHQFFNSAGAERVRIDNDGLKFNGDTAAANALDDYEEGTWTPAIISGYTAITYSAQVGKYTKIGDVVSFRLGIAITAATADANRLKITLPTIVGQSTAASIGFSNISGLSTTDTPFIVVEATTDLLEFYLPDGSGGSFTGNSANDTSWALTISGTYFV